ncbi:MAG: DJ-1 family glyoxalase III [Rectinemataceae bacterium]|jgi:4-methyl-5(b-hydroxyethyl)-thiazole monophosphate biosynthesis
MKTVCVLLADGFEEVEAVTPIDYLRRAGIEVRILGVTGGTVSGSHGIKIEATLGSEGFDGDYDCIVVPGGGRGADNIAASPAAVRLIRRHFEAGRLVAAICAAPAVVLHAACGILKGRRFTGYPGTETKVEGAIFSEDRVVMDGNLITSRAAGSAGEFARAIVSALEGEGAAAGLASSVLLQS